MREELNNIIQPGNAVLIQGDIDSRKGIFANIIIEDFLSENKKIGMFSFNSQHMIQYLSEKLPEKKELIITAEMVDELTQFGIDLSKALSGGAELIYSDNFNILSSKTDFEPVFQSYNFNLKKIREKNAVFVEVIDGSSLEDVKLHKIESIFDIVITLRFENGSFFYKIKKHLTELSEDEVQVNVESFSISQDSIIELYKTSIRYQIESAVLYASLLSSLPEEERPKVQGLVDSSIKHVNKIIEILKSSKEKEENLPKEEIVKLLKEGLKEERMMKDHYSKLGPHTEIAEEILEISKQEDADEKIVLELLRKFGS